MEGSPTKSCWIYFPIFLVILLLNSSVANNNNNNHNNSSLGRLVLKKNFLNDQNIFIEESLFPENDFLCRTIVNLTTKYGFVKNPDYPKSYKVPIFCQWNIVGTEPDEIIIISIDELDIDNPNERSKHCAADSSDWKQCCQPNYLRLYSAKNSEKYFCGKSSQMRDGNHSNVFISEKNIISITFNATTNRKNAAGFYFSYFITSKFSAGCFENEYRCKNGRCVPKKWVCNNKNECGDGSDELACNSMVTKQQHRWLPLPSLTDRIPCGNDDGKYYSLKQKCDHRFDCLNKADENGCHYCDRNQFRCLSMDNKCINDSLVCNGLPDCPDLSDELVCHHHTHCPPDFLLCGVRPPCFDAKSQRCNKILDCPNGVDEHNCFEHCPGKIMCSSGDGCYDVEERCNGIVQCADYSDEKNCTIELCNIDKGSFLCSNGRCIPSIWTCDRSADCFDGSDEMRCLKNSVITAAIIGSLICGLLIVIAISCGCKLIALRHLEQYRNSIANVGTSRRNPIRNGMSEPFPFPPPGDLDASLFRLEHSVLFREPPPSYASTMGGYHDVNAANNSYMDQYRRYRRQRRCRRILRRQHRNNNNGGPQQQQTQSTNGSGNHGLINLTINNHDESPIDSFNSSMVANHDHRRHHHHHHHSNDHLPSSIETTEMINENNENDSNSIVATSYFRNDQDKKPETSMNKENNGPMIMTGGNSDGESVVIVSPTAQATTANNLNIELEPIPPLTNFDCDSQPLIR